MAEDYVVVQNSHNAGELIRLTFNDRSGFYPRIIDGKSVAWPHGEWKRDGKDAPDEPRKFVDKYWNGHEVQPPLAYDVSYEVDWRKFNQIGIKETVKRWATSTDYKSIQTTFVFRHMPPGYFARVTIPAFEGCTVTTFTNAVGQPSNHWIVTRGPTRGGVLRPLARDAERPPDFTKTREAWEKKRKSYLDRLNGLSKEELEQRKKDFGFWADKGKEEQFVDEMGNEVCFGEVKESDNPDNEMFVYLEGSCLILSTLRMPPAMVADVARKAAAKYKRMP